MNKSNKIRLVDAIRSWLVSQDRMRVARTLTQETTRRELCLLTNLPPDTSLEELRVRYDVEYIRVGDVGFGPPKSSILIDVHTGREREFSSLGQLRRHLDNIVDKGTLSCIIDEGGCIVPVRGRDKYLVADRDVDLLRLPYCTSNIVLVRLILSYMGYNVTECNTPREMFNMVGLRLDPGVDINDNKYLMRRLCEFVGKEYTPKGYSPRDMSRRRVTLYSVHRNPMEFPSIKSAATWLRIDLISLTMLAERGEPCPYFGYLYFIRIHREE